MLQTPDVRRYRLSAVCGCALAAWMLLGGCHREQPDVLGSLGQYRDRMLVTHQADADRNSAERRAGPPRAYPVSSQAEQSGREALLTAPATTTQPAPADVLIEIPDPSDASEVFARRLQKLTEPRQAKWVINNYSNTIAKAQEYLERLRQPQQVRLGLAECIQRALDNSYIIRMEAYSPAIAQAQLVEAEAGFDATFFLDTLWSHNDNDTASQLAANKSDTRSIEGGIRKLLPTGMSASVSLRTERQHMPGFQFQTLNPAYSTTFNASISQPLLRGFGLDYNRAAINIARADQRIAQHRFAQQVRDTLLNVEMAYWRLVQARRDVMILAETVAQNFVTYKRIKDRGFDATAVGIYNAESRWKSREVQFQQAVKNVRDAEDQLKNLLNDPALKLSDAVEIIPTETPLVAAIALDHFAEVRVALDHRSEIHQAKLEIEKARIGTARAKNETLPQLDLTFQYRVQGLKGDADSSWDRMATHRFRSYTLGATFSYPFGNRRARAAWRRARTQESQMLVALDRTVDTVVQEINGAVRTLMTDYENIPPQLDAARASEQNLRALQARAIKTDPPYLETQLNTIEQLANTRSVLLRVVTDYNIAVVELEKAKGTLLEYNNVVISDERPAD